MLLMGRKKSQSEAAYWLSRDKATPAEAEAEAEAEADPLKDVDPSLASELDAFGYQDFIPKIVRRFEYGGVRWMIIKIGEHYTLRLFHPDFEKWILARTPQGYQPEFKSIAAAEQFARVFDEIHNNPVYEEAAARPSRVFPKTTSPYNKSMFSDLDAVKNVLVSLGYPYATDNEGGFKTAVHMFQKDWNGFVGSEAYSSNQVFAYLQVDGIPGVQTLRAMEWIKSKFTVGARGDDAGYWETWLDKS